MKTLPADCNLESRVREVLASQASVLHPPDVRPDDAVVIVGAATDLRLPMRRRRVLLAAAAVGLLAAAGIGIAVRNIDGIVEPASPVDGGLHFATPQVSFDATSVEVVTNGRTFVPPPDTSVGGDPGTWNEYTTLELEWYGGGVPMRIFMYFASDGTDWWATELRTYDGSADPKWIEMPGEFFRSPLGTAWRGDLDVQSLHVHGLKLEAFVRPAACGSATGPLALVADYPTIEGISAPAMGFGGSVTLLDTATCAPTSFAGVEFSVTSRDETVARIDRSEAYGTGGFRFELSFPTPGTTTVHVAASDKATGELIDQVDIPVTASGAAPTDNTPST